MKNEINKNDINEKNAQFINNFCTKNNFYMRYSVNDKKRITQKYFRVQSSSHKKIIVKFKKTLQLFQTQDQMI